MNNVRFLKRDEMPAPLPVFTHSATGRVMTVHDLPARVLRWTPHTKATMLRAVKAGAITREELCKRYGISEAEYQQWSVRYRVMGVTGLKSFCEALRDLRGGARA